MLRLPIAGPVLFVVSLFAFSTLVSAQSDKNAGGLSKTFFIESVDAAKRVLTLKDGDGNVESMSVAPSVQKLNELKAGDKVNVRYFEPMLAAVRPAGQAAPAPSPDQPAGAPSMEVTASGEITAIDPKAPSFSIRTSDGQALKFQVGDKKIVEALKAGDKVDISYMRAFATKVDKK
jgi:hypothetical protein